MRSSQPYYTKNPMKKWDIVWVLLARHHENPYSNSFHRNSFLPSGSRMQLASRLVALPCQSAPRVRKLGHWLYRHITAITLALTMPPSTSLLTPSTWCAFPQAVVAGLEDSPAMCHVPCEAGDLGVAPWSRGYGTGLAQLAELNSMGAILVGSPVLHNTRSMA